MKKRTEGFLFVGFYCCSAFVWLLLGCLALKHDYEWLAVFIIMRGFLPMMLLAHASLIAGAIKDALEEKTKQEETENRDENRDLRAIEKAGEEQRKD